MSSSESTDREVLSPAARIGDTAIILAMLGLLAFLLIHQLRGTGFFTTEFGPFEMFCLYGPILVQFAAPVIRVVTGRRNPARPYEAATNLFLMVGSLWLLIRFPFDFSHLADVLPEGLQFLLAWVTDLLGGIALALQVITAPINAVRELWRYAKGRHHDPPPVALHRPL